MFIINLKTNLIEPEQEQLIAFDRQIIHQNNIGSYCKMIINYLFNYENIFNIYYIDNFIPKRSVSR